MFLRLFLKKIKKQMVMNLSVVETTSLV